MNQRLPEFDGLWDALDHTTSETKQPTPKLITACRSCSRFENECLGNGIKRSILSPPNLHRNRLAELSNEGIIDVGDVSNDFKLTAIQKRVVDCIRSGRSWVPDGGDFNWRWHRGEALERIAICVRSCDTV